MTTPDNELPNSPELRTHVAVLEVHFSDGSRAVAVGSSYTEQGAKQNALLTAKVTNRGRKVTGYRNAPVDVFERANEG